MPTFFIALLISLGVITSTESENMTDQQKQELIDQSEIIITDYTHLWRYSILSNKKNQGDS